MGVLSAMVGYQIHHDEFWAFMNVLFWPASWIWWVMYHEVTLTIIKTSFEWFFK
jgi:hypothetical protein